MTTAMIVQPIVGALVVFFAAMVARSTARGIAELQGRQKAQDNEIKHFGEYADACRRAVQACQLYVYVYGTKNNATPGNYAGQSQAVEALLSANAAVLEVANLGEAIPDREHTKEFKSFHADTSAALTEFMSGSYVLGDTAIGRDWTEILQRPSKPIFLSQKHAIQLQAQLLRDYPTKPGGKKRIRQRISKAAEDGARRRAEKQK